MTSKSSHSSHHSEAERHLEPGHYPELKRDGCSTDGVQRLYMYCSIHGSVSSLPQVSPSSTFSRPRGSFTAFHKTFSTYAFARSTSFLSPTITTFWLAENSRGMYILTL